jgi:hypothetical protein
MTPGLCFCVMAFPIGNAPLIALFFSLRRMISKLSLDATE